MIRPQSPWRQPVVWLLVALPVGSVIASAILIVFAVRSGGDDAIADRVQRTAQIQVADLQPDVQAEKLGLTALIRFDRKYVEVLPVTGSFDRKASLTVALRHPMRSDADLSFQLTPSDSGWRAERAITTAHAWRIQLAAPDVSWRLHGRLPKGQRAIHLAPAVAAP